MTAAATSLTGAPSSASSWHSMDWKTIEAQVYRLQMRIAKATREGRHGKVKALQWLLTHSFNAKALAVKRVVQNRGGKTPGVDNIIWKTATQKMQAALSLTRKGYQPQPLKRIYIPKKDGRQRPLSIPTMKCRGMQALHLLALEPVVETKADKNTYGFRPKRSAADAIEKCFKALGRKRSAQWILEADIKSCFDKISHTWLKDNILMDKRILQKWLEAGYIDKGILHQRFEGTPQGALISPALLNATLSGLENVVLKAAPKRSKVHICVYADDFIITGESRELLEETIKPLVENFLHERGLELSQNKTKITHIRDGFNFLGFNIRKYKDKLIIKPAKESIKSLLGNIRGLIRKNCTSTTLELIRQLNPKIRGWAYYYRFVVADRTFKFVDTSIFKALWRWVKRRHSTKSAQWRRKTYFRTTSINGWTFYAKNSSSKVGLLDLEYARNVCIKRHVKVRENANIYDPAYKEYFADRNKKIKIIRSSRVEKNIGLKKIRAV